MAEWRLAGLAPNTPQAGGSVPRSSVGDAIPGRSYPGNPRLTKTLRSGCLHKERYYEALEASSQGWHEGKNDPWPYIHFVLYILKTAYKEFERRVGEVAVPRGAKTDRVHDAVRAFPGEFTIADLERACPGISRDMVRRVLRDMKANEQVECLGRGPGARWRKKG